jgi:hypothetical protein
LINITTLEDLMKKTSLIMVFTFIFINLASHVMAKTDRSSDEWQFALSPLFLWGMSVDGTQQIGPVSAPLELNFTDDLLENIAAVFTFHFEAHKKDLTLFTEYQYVKLDPSTKISNGPTVDVDFTVQKAEFGAGYRVATWWGNTDVEPILGLRWTYQDLELGPQIGLSLVDSTESWWDVFAGVRLWTHFTDKWTLVSRGDIGAGGSDLVWNVSFIVNYQYKDWVSTFFGYRVLDYDYDNGSGPSRYAYDATEQGPLLGLTFYW